MGKRQRSCIAIPKRRLIEYPDIKTLLDVTRKVVEHLGTRCTVSFKAYLPELSFAPHKPYVGSCTLIVGQVCMQALTEYCVTNQIDLKLANLTVEENEQKTTRTNLWVGSWILIGRKLELHRGSRSTQSMHFSARNRCTFLRLATWTLVGRKPGSS